jgi:hypothetical protein
MLIIGAVCAGCELRGGECALDGSGIVSGGAIVGG